MAQLFDFKKVTVGPRALVATVELAPSAPVVTSDDSNAVDLVLGLMPGLSDHVCLGDVAPTFGEVAHDTELAHLLEHVTVELIAQTNLADDVSCGQTVEVGERAYEITLGCPDDVLVAGALSSAAWVLQWAFSGGGDPQPDVAAIVDGLVGLVESVSDQVVEKNVEPEPAPEDEPMAEEGPELVSETESESEPEPETEPDPEPTAEELEADFAPVDALASEVVEESEPEPEITPEPEAVPEPEPEPEPEPALESAPEPDLTPDPEPAPDPDEPQTTAPNPWDMDDVPRPHLVR